MSTALENSKVKPGTQKKLPRVDPEKVLVTGRTREGDLTNLAKRLDALYILSVTLTVWKKFDWVV